MGGLWQEKNCSEDVEKSITKVFVLDKDTALHWRAQLKLVLRSKDLRIIYAVKSWSGQMETNKLQF